MKRRRQGGFEHESPRLAVRLVGFAIMLGVTFAMLEAASLGWIRWQRGILYYTSERAATGDVPAALQLPGAVFHPYLAFLHRVGRSGTGWVTNNVGFQVDAALAAAEPGCCDYPLTPRDNAVLVGVFGGSVATGFALHEQAAKALARRLQAIDAYRDRPVRVLNFAMPGYRQPQQLIALAYFQTLGQKLDIALEIDGFNEIVTSHRNFQSGIEPSFPADTLWGEWGRHLERSGGGSGEAAATAGLAGYYRFRAARLNEEAQDCLLASCHLAKRALSRLASWRARQLDRGRKQTQATLFPTALRSKFPAEFDVFRYTADQWRDTSLAMAAMARQAGTLYLHVLQPNQWWRESGSYRPIAEDHIYGWVVELVNKGYPELVARMPALRAAGVEVLDATMLFKDQDLRAAYIDDCCHYTVAGNDQLSGAIADAVAAIHAEGRAPAPR